MHIHPTVKVSDTTDKEIEDLNLKHECPGCGHVFVNKHGMLVHWVDGAMETRTTIHAKAHWLTKQSNLSNKKLQKAPFRMFTLRMKRLTMFTYLFILETSNSAMEMILLR